MSFVLNNKPELIGNILRAVCTSAQSGSDEYTLNPKNAARMSARLAANENGQDAYAHIPLLSTASELFCTDIPACDICPVNKLCGSFLAEQKKLYREKLKDGITFADLFCGAGGASLGFEQAGLMPVFALDYEKNAISTYSFNRPCLPDDMIVRDTAENILSETRIQREITGVSRRPHIVLGGVPCQCFSNANRQRLIDDTRNELYKYFVNAVRFLKPQIVVMENVVGIRKISSQITEDFFRIGYHLDYRVFDALDFGVPQYRKRVIFIGVPKRDIITDNTVLNDIFSGIEAKLKGPGAVLRDAIENLRPLSPSRKRNNPDFEDEVTGYKIDTSAGAVQNEYLSVLNAGIRYHVIYNHKARYNNDRDIEIFKRLPQGENSLHETIRDIMPYKERNGIFKDKYYKLKADEPCKTITAHMKFDCNMYIHPVQPRGLTVREAARIQSFPDDYIITGTFQKLYEQVGNAIPPLMAKTIGEVIKEYIDAGRNEERS